jgi:hypothetical protein
VVVVAVVVVAVELRQCGLSPGALSEAESCCFNSGGGGSLFGLMRRALCIFAPRSTPNELLLIAVMLFSLGRVVAWPLAVAAEERQHAIQCLGLCPVLLAFHGPIATHSHQRNYKQ